MCVVDPEGTRVLTGSTWGELKLWAAPIGGQPLHLPSSDPPLGLDLRLPYGAQPHDVVRTMAVPRCGGVAWSGGKHNVAIWDATTGAFLGTISQAENPPSHAIDVSAGLTMDSFGRVVVHLTPGHDARETQASDKFGDLKAAKAKVRRGRGGEAGRGNGGRGKGQR